jgi:desulfoferrodoxin (superoxide reductase-like protein)
LIEIRKSLAGNTESYSVGKSSILFFLPLNILRQIQEKLDILWNLLFGVNNNNNNNNNVNLEENLQPIEEVKTVNTSEIDSIENFQLNFDDCIYKIKLAMSGINHPNPDEYFMDWIDTFSTSNKPQLLLLTSFTVINCFQWYIFIVD